MVSLLDITPSAARAITVSVRGQDVNVSGLSIADIAYLIQQFPEVKDMFSGKEVTLTLDDVLGKAPDLVCGLIACGTGLRGNKAAETMAGTLSIEEQTDMLEAILAETFKGGLGPFVAKVTRVLGLGDSVAGTREPDSSGLKPPNP